MHRSVLVAALVVVSALAPSRSTSAPYTSKRVATREDVAAIRKVHTDFMAAIAAKDGRKLSTLVLNDHILLAPMADQARVDAVRKYNSNFDGVGDGGFSSFAHYISTTSDKLEEKTYNVEVTQDGLMALVTFDYEFVINGKVSNYGLEVWQLRKTDGKWKIFSGTWTQYEPKQ
jgi:ketosteroid isomerase-like protein